MCGIIHCYYVIVYMVLLRKQEFEQAALQFFCAPSEHRQWYYHWQKRRLRWWKQVRYNLCLWYTVRPSPTSCSRSSQAFVILWCHSFCDKSCGGALGMRLSSCTLSTFDSALFLLCQTYSFAFVFSVCLSSR